MIMSARPFRALCAFLGLVATGLVASGAEPWPARSISLVVAFPPSTTPDFAARAIAQDLSGVLGHPVVVETRAGAGGVVGSATVAKAPADGHTLLVTGVGPSVLRPLVDDKLAYDAVADFAPIILIGDGPNMLAVSPQSGFASVRDVVAYAKQNPGKLTIGHSGPGTINHLIGLLFAAEAGIEANFIAYAGSAPIVTNLAGGHIDAGFIAAGPSSGAAKILAAATDERVGFLPSVPTLKDTGFPAVVGSTWNGIFAPAGLPPEIVARLNAAIDAFLHRGDTRKQFAAVGFRILGGPPERLRERMAADRAKWSPVVRSAGIRVDR
jgi:tripartite-type tricarboxylate transporter receptor subunit TctC